MTPVNGSRSIMMWRKSITPEDLSPVKLMKSSCDMLQSSVPQLGKTLVSSCEMWNFLEIHFNQSRMWGDDQFCGSKHNQNMNDYATSVCIEIRNNWHLNRSGNPNFINTRQILNLQYSRNEMKQDILLQYSYKLRQMWKLLILIRYFLIYDDAYYLGDKLLETEDHHRLLDCCQSHR